jgi:predicted ABC-type transport system involved in lysophospholipase L1 biosynthesis ATPase subunit
VHADRRTTLVMATHSMSLAARADRVIHLHDGRITTDRYGESFVGSTVK